MAPVPDAQQPKKRPPTPEPLPVAVVDNHTHIDYEDAAEISELLRRAAAVGVDRILQIGCSVAGAQRTIELIERYPSIAGGVALHPNEAGRLGETGGLEEAFRTISELAEHPRVVAIAETGLDYFRTDTASSKAMAAQAESFRWHIALAKKLGKPMQIHNRNADSDTLAILAAEGAPEKTVFHCFSATPDVAAECVDRGYYLSFAGNVTFKNAEALRDSLAVCPLDRILVETDAPYLTPTPHRGKPNSSYLIPHTVQVMADVLDESVRTVCEAIAANTNRVYGSWESFPSAA